jgi:hypothetical protein
VGDQLYRIFVILDPANKIAETHEWEDRFKQPAELDGQKLVDPLSGSDTKLEAGQNNQGFGLLAVHAPASEAFGALADAENPCEPKDAAVGSTPDVSLDPRGLRVADGRRPRVGRRAALQVAVQSTHRDLREHHVLVYDGHPSGGGELVGAAIAQGISDADGSDVTVSWLPRAAGRHRLYARLLEHGGDARPGNGLARLDVRVRPHRVVRPRLRDLPARVRERSYPRRARRKLVRIARRSNTALRRGSLAGARRKLGRFVAVAGRGRGRTVAARDVAALRFDARRIRADLRIGKLQRVTPRALRGNVTAARRAIRARQFAKARRHLRRVARRARADAPRAAVRARRLELQLR